MKDEILAAVLFLVRFIEKRDTFPRDKLDAFKTELIDLLTERFKNHWFPDRPTKGQGYRCIRVNELHPVDLVLQKAATLAGLTYNDLQLPIELTVWVDPNEVCCRFGESEGSYCTLATFPDKENHLVMSERIDRSVSPASDSSSGSVEVHHKPLVLNFQSAMEHKRGTQKKYRNKYDTTLPVNSYSSHQSKQAMVVGGQQNAASRAGQRSALSTQHDLNHSYFMPPFDVHQGLSGYNAYRPAYSRVSQYHNILTV